MEEKTLKAARWARWWLYSAELCHEGGYWGDIICLDGYVILTGKTKYSEVCVFDADKLTDLYDTYAEEAPVDDILDPYERMGADSPQSKYEGIPEIIRESEVKEVYCG